MTAGDDSSHRSSADYTTEFLMLVFIPVATRLVKLDSVDDDTRHCRVGDSQSDTEDS